MKELGRWKGEGKEGRRSNKGREGVNMIKMHHTKCMCGNIMMKPFTMSNLIITNENVPIVNFC
jgi:hypothetical protein